MDRIFLSEHGNHSGQVPVRKQIYGREQTNFDHAAGRNGRTQMEAFEAAKVVLQDSDLRLEPYLIVTLRKGRRPLNRSAAAYAMQSISTTKTIDALERTVADRSEDPGVRGHAAEALIHNHRNRSHDALLKALIDPSREVRFWCAFALGQMAERRAIPLLEYLVATDKRIVKGWWSVAEEAADAINNIQTEMKWARRENGCAFCLARSRRNPRG